MCIWQIANPLHDRRVNEYVMTLTEPQSEREYDFVLELTGGVPLTAELDNALFETGCDDATTSVRSGRVYLTFSRRSSSMQTAISIAIEQVRSAHANIDVRRVDPG
jgi:hypothetical protein